MKLVSLKGVELGIDHDPAVLPGTPVLDDPVVLVVIGLKIRREATAYARGDPAMAQHSTEHDREVSTGPQHAGVRLTGHVERARIARGEVLELARDGTDLHLGSTCLGDFDAIGLRPQKVDHQPLNDAT